MRIFSPWTCASTFRVTDWPFGGLGLAVPALEDDVRFERLVFVDVEPVHEQLLALADDVLLAPSLMIA